MASSLRGRCALACFVDPLVEVRLPELDQARREDAVSFVLGRWERMSSVPAFGIGSLAVAIWPALWVAGRVHERGRQQFIGWLTRRRLPLVRDLVDFSLALSAAFAFERWPPDA